MLKLVLKPNGYDFSFVNEGGTTVDSGSNSCHGAPPVDTTPPDTSIASGPDGGRRERDVSYSFVSSEAGGSFRCRLDGPGGAIGNESSCTSPMTYTGLADGPYTFHVYARDAANNADPSAATRSFTVDTAAPDTSITSGPEGTTESTSAAFSFASTEAGSTFECRIDGGACAGCGSPATYEGLAEGGHTFETRATDALGNVDATPAARSFTVDPPEATVPDPVDDISLKHFRPAAYEIASGRVYRGRGARRRLFVDDGDRLEIAAAEKRSGRFVSSFESFMAIGRDARSSLRSMTLTYSGCTSARGAKVVLSVFNHRTDKWVKAFTCTGRRERSFDWDSSAFARDYFTRNGTLTLRVKGKHDAPFRTRTDLLELAASL